MTLQSEDAKHYIAGGVYAKEWIGKAGDAIQQHKHKFDHMSYLAVGLVRVEVDDRPTLVLEGPTAISIKAGKSHKITALSDCLWLCIHRIPDDLRGEDLLDEHLIEGTSQ